MAQTLLRRTGGVLLLLVAAVLGLAAAVAGFLGAAVATASIPLLVTAALAALFGVTFLTAWPGYALYGVVRRRRAAVVSAGVLAVLVAALSGVTVLRPMARPADQAVPPDVHFWNLPTGSRIAYREAAATGPAHPAPVIFLHGGPGTANDDISEVGRALATDGFDVYSYDQVGSGRSSRLRDVTQYTDARQVADLDAIRRTIGAERIILVGQSWGGSLAAHYMAAHPDRVAKAVLSSPGVLWYGAFPDGETGELFDRLTPDAKRRFDSLTSSPRMIALALLQQVNPEAAHHLVGDREADQRFREILTASLPAAQCPGRPPASLPDNRTGFYVNQFTIDDAEHLPDPRPRLRAAHVPTLIMRGECDYKKWEVTYDYKRTLPDSTLVYVPGAGHAIAIDRPAIYQAALRAFLLDRPLPLPPYTAATPPDTAAGQPAESTGQRTPTASDGR
ncbi:MULTISPECIES: alpha/beta hydrolase [unclassified Streptomyces]|uniref:alpha/beta hydrolase n=1 Tax=unclassified Streptomyces TaxID=2593676 RepID=UPI002E2E7FF9|nr:alpha/beta hydrolase [Streptomyces sp. NBC_00223]